MKQTNNARKKPAAASEKLMGVNAVIPIEGNIYEAFEGDFDALGDAIYVFVDVVKGGKKYRLMYQDLGNNGNKDFRLYDSDGTNNDAWRYINDTYGIDRGHKDYAARISELSSQYLNPAFEVFMAKITEIMIVSLVLGDCGLRGSEILINDDEWAQPASEWVIDLLEDLSEDTLSKMEKVTSGAELRELLIDVIAEVGSLEEVFVMTNPGEVTIH